VAVSGGYAYVADAYGGLRVIDVSDPTTPVEVGALGTPEAATGLAVSGDLVYLADGHGGLRVVDVSVPAWPVEVGAAATLAVAENVAVSDGHAFVAETWAGMSVFRGCSSVLFADDFESGGTSRWSAVVGGAQ
jgi:hypothetical protein